MALIADQLAMPVRAASGRHLLMGPLVPPDAAGQLCVPVRMSDGRLVLTRVAPGSVTDTTGIPVRLSTGKPALVKIGVVGLPCFCCPGDIGPISWTVTMTNWSGEWTWVNGTWTVPWAGPCAWHQGIPGGVVETTPQDCTYRLLVVEMDALCTYIDVSCRTFCAGAVMQARVDWRITGLSASELCVYSGNVPYWSCVDGSGEPFCTCTDIDCLAIAADPPTCSIIPNYG